MCLFLVCSPEVGWAITLEKLVSTSKTKEPAIILVKFKWGKYLEMISNQKQVSGDNSTQIIAQNVIVGIDEKRAREIYDEKYEIAKANFTSEAIQIANSRIQEFEENLMRKMKEAGALQSFADPGMQLSLIEAQKSAAQCENKSDYELLSELLLQKHLNRSRKEMVSGVDRAVKIVHEMSVEALMALTAVYVVEALGPVTGVVDDGLDLLDKIFSKIIQSDLPTGIEWIEHAELLGAVRVIPYQPSYAALDDIFKRKFNGYICTGIKENSNEHERALTLLDANFIPRDILVANQLNPGYLRLSIPEEQSISKVSIRKLSQGSEIVIPLNEAQRAALNNIFAMYENNAEGMSTSLENFKSRWMDRQALKKISEWWPTIKMSFTFTKVGSVLSHANSQRCEISIPNIT